MAILVWLDYDDDDFWLISMRVPNLPSDPEKGMNNSQKGWLALKRTTNPWVDGSGNPWSWWPVPVRFP